MQRVGDDLPSRLLASHRAGDMAGLDEFVRDLSAEDRNSCIEAISLWAHHGPKRAGDSPEQLVKVLLMFPVSEWCIVHDSARAVAWGCELWTGFALLGGLAVALVFTSHTLPACTPSTVHCFRCHP